MIVRPAAAAAFLVALVASGRAADLESTAAQAVAAHDFARARDLYATLARAHPERLDYLVWEARLAGWGDDYAAADALYDRVLARDPRHVEALVGKAYVASWDRRYEEADRLLDAAEAVAPGDPEIAEARERNARARRWRAVGVEDARAELSGGFQYEDYSYTSGAQMAFVRGRYRGRFTGFLEAQHWDKFGEQSTRVGGGVSGRLAPKWPFSLEAWIDPGSDVLPRDDFLAYVGRVLPWRLGAGFAYRYADFSDARVQVVSGTLEYYFAFPVWVTGTYFHSITQSSRPNLDGGDDAFALRAHYRALPRLTVHAAYAYGGESYEDLSIDRIGRFQANTFEGGADVAITEHVAVWLGGAYQLRDDGHTVTTAAASVSYRWR